MFDYPSAAIDVVKRRFLVLFYFLLLPLGMALCESFCPTRHDQVSRVGMSLHRGAFISMAADIPSEANARSA